MELLSTFSEQIKELIFDKNISPEILSNSIDIDLSLIYKWQRAESVPNLNNLIKLSYYFEVSIDYLSGRNESGYFSKIDIPTPFNIRLQEIIAKSGLSKCAFSKKYNISRVTIQHWVNNERVPLLDSLIRLADKLDVTIDFLVGLE